jgi:hypothetical protein
LSTAFQEAGIGGIQKQVREGGGWLALSSRSGSPAGFVARIGYVASYLNPVSPRMTAAAILI